MKYKASVFAAILLSTVTFASAASAYDHIVSIGGDVTEIVYALGEGKHVACVDVTSLYPAAVHRVRKVGYLRTLSAEGVLSCRPDVIIAAEGAGPASAIHQLQAAKIPMAQIRGDKSPAAVIRKIASVAKALGVPERGKALIRTFRAGMAKTNAELAQYKKTPRVLFLMAHGPGGAMAAGNGTAADAMLKLAKAENVGSGFSGYKPLTPEAAAALKPDVIIIDSYSLKMLGGLAAFEKKPEIALTPAAKQHRIKALDTMFILGFGPRTPQAITALARAVHGQNGK